MDIIISFLIISIIIIILIIIPGFHSSRQGTTSGRHGQNNCAASFEPSGIQQNISPYG